MKCAICKKLLFYSGDQRHEPEVTLDVDVHTRMYAHERCWNVLWSLDTAALVGAGEVTTVAAERARIDAMVSPETTPVCPCCDAECKVQSKSITPKFARFFIALVKASDAQKAKDGNEWVNMREFVRADTQGKVNHDASVLWVWGILDRRPAGNEAYYMPTAKGRKFYEDKIAIPYTRYTYRTKRWDKTAEWDEAHPPTLKKLSACLDAKLYAALMASPPFKVGSRERCANAQFAEDTTDVEPPNSNA